MELEIKIGDTLKWRDFKEVHTVLDIDPPKEKSIRWVTLLRGEDDVLIDKWSVNYHYLKTLLNEGSISVNGAFILQKNIKEHNLNVR